MDADAHEEHVFDCAVLGAETLITIDRPPIERVYDPHLALKIPMPDVRQMMCANLENCGIAQRDSRGSVISASWERCPAAQTLKEKRSL